MFWSGGNGQNSERLRPAIEFHQRGLIHVAKPEIAVAVAAQSETAGRKPRLVLRDRKFGHLAALRIEPSQILLAEAGKPDHAVGIDDDVMRRDGFARQVVFGVDDPRCPSARPRHGLECVAPGACALIDRAQEVRGCPIDLHALIVAFLHQPLGATQLRMRRHALIHVALHARHDLRQKIIRRVFRAGDALERMAADAIEELAFLRVGARDAGKPFAVRELCGKVFGLAQAQLDRALALAGNFNVGRPVELVTDGTDGNRVLARPDLAGREAEATVLVADNGYGDARPGLSCADQHAFHGRLVGGSDNTRQGRLLRWPGREARKRHRERKSDECKMQQAAHQALPEIFLVLGRKLSRQARPARARL